MRSFDGSTGGGETHVAAVCGVILWWPDVSMPSEFFILKIIQEKKSVNLGKACAYFSTTFVYGYR